MKFEIGKTYKTLSGKEAEILAIREGKVIGWMSGDVETWDEETGHYMMDGRKSQLDLIATA